MPEPITSLEFELVQEWIKVGVLKKVDANGIKGRENGAIPVFCGDPRQSPDIMRYLETRITSTPFLFAFPGGALLIPKHSPLNRDFPHGDGMVRLIRFAHELQPSFPLMLKAHGPCAAAKSEGLTLIDEARLVKEAKQRLLEEIPTLSDDQITCHFHMDLAPHVPEDERRKMWFVSGPNWQQWLQLSGYLWQHKLKDQRLESHVVV